ncbi:hypothetical protein GWC92_08285 [Aeromonas caviae]|nr:hypothetical protein GWC92_08285 [Aeromonas caviae]
MTPKPCWPCWQKPPRCGWRKPARVNGCAIILRPEHHGCLSWKDTETLLAMLAEAAKVHLDKLG